VASASLTAHQEAEKVQTRVKIKKIANRLNSLSASKRVPYYGVLGGLAHGRLAKVLGSIKIFALS
jgi:hypothetical protein